MASLAQPILIQETQNVSKKPSDELSYKGESVSAWMEKLQSGEAAQRQEAAQALLSLSQAVTATLPGMRAALDHVTGDARAQAAETLGNVGARLLAWIPTLQAALKRTVMSERDEAIRTSALRALLLLEPQGKSNVPSLIEALQDELPGVRADAAFALGELGPDAKDAVARLRHVSLWDVDMGARVQAAVALWRIRQSPAGVVEVLIKALQQGDELLRWTAADCLGEMGEGAREAVPVLQQILETPFKSRMIHLGIALALERIAPEAVTGP